MSEYIVLNDPAWGEYLAKIAATTYNPAVDINFCRTKDDMPMGGVIFSGNTGESIGIHSASVDPKWINRDMLFITFDYPFKQLGVNRIFGQVPEDNYHARLFNEKLGFKDVARIEGVFPGGVACIVMRMEREECKYLDIRPTHDPRSEYFARPRQVN